MLVTPETPIIVEPSALAGFAWEDVFGNDHPVELEIGTGKGTFLLRRAQSLPERNFLGIEWCNEIFRYAADRMRRWRLTNVRMVRTDASLFIRHHCPRGSLQVLHIYHPDPWPKLRHRKRRLFQPAFVEAAAECLMPGGRLAVQTDHGEYFEQIARLLRGVPSLVETPFTESEDGREVSAAAEELRLGTNFETKYAREGREFYRIALRRHA